MSGSESIRSFWHILVVFVFGEESADEVLKPPVVSLFHCLDSCVAAVGNKDCNTVFFEEFDDFFRSLCEHETSAIEVFDFTNERGACG